MANTIAVRVVAMYSDTDVALTNFFRSGAFTKKGKCVIDIEGHEAEVNIEDLLNAVIALEQVHGND